MAHKSSKKAKLKKLNQTQSNQAIDTAIDELQHQASGYNVSSFQPYTNTTWPPQPRRVITMVVVRNSVNKSDLERWKNAVSETGAIAVVVEYNPNAPQPPRFEVFAA